MAASRFSYYLLGQGYRAYNPVLMRFASADSWSPFGRGGLNAYAYCGGDPVNASDPSGHFLWFGTMKSQLSKLSLGLFGSSARMSPRLRRVSQSTEMTDVASLSDFDGPGNTPPASAPSPAKDFNVFFSDVNFPDRLLKHFSPTDLTALRSTTTAARDRVDVFSQTNFDRHSSMASGFRPSHEKGLASPVEKLITAGMGELPGVAISQASKQMSLSAAKALYRDTHSEDLTVKVGISKRDETFFGTPRRATHVLVRAVRKAP